MSNKPIRIVLDGEYETGAELVERINSFVGSPFTLTANTIGALHHLADDSDDEQSDQPAPTKPLPAAPAGAPSVFNDTPTVDGRGCPWDERVHSGGRAINGDGSWKKRKGVSPTDVAKIEAQLMAAAVNALQPAPNAPVAGPAPIAPKPNAPAGPGTPPALTVVENAPKTFLELIRWTAKHSNTPSNPNGKLQQSQIDHIVAHYGFSVIQDIQAKAEYVPYVYQYLTQSIDEPFLPGHVEIV